MKFCMTIMGFNVLYISFDFVKYVTKCVQACLCYVSTFADNLLLHMVTMSA